MRAGQYVLIAVADTGTGMTADVIAKAFDPFFTTKEVGKGTGLGLSQVYGFVRQSGGHVKIYSEVGVGTTVKIYLPRHYGEARDRTHGSRSPSCDGARTRDVMVVEDDDRVRARVDRSVARAWLRRDRSVSSPARSAAAARNRARRSTLLFTDVVMPDMSGRQLADRAREKHADLKVLYTTGYTRNAIVHNGMLDPGTNLLTKPFSVEELAYKVRAMLDT